MFSFLSIVATTIACTAFSGLGIAYLQGRFELPGGQADVYGMSCFSTIFGLIAALVFKFLLGWSLLLSLPLILVLSAVPGALMYLSIHSHELGRLSQFHPANLLRELGKRHRQDAGE